MTSIIGFAELLRDAGEDADGRIRRYAGNILTSGRMLLELINDLLDLAKIEAGRTDLHRTEFHLKDVCDGLADFFQPVADKKHITLSVVNDGEWPVMKSDAGKIKQILYNLLSNAIKFTPDGGRVELSVRTNDSDRVELRVCDTGPGIPENQRESIFEPFRQLDGSVTREHGGTGLGLTISRELARALGGSLRLAERNVANAPSPGAEFVVELPLDSPSAVLSSPVRLN
jgi:signal transduction histidine kinase